MRPDFNPSQELFPFTSRWFDSSVGAVHYIDEGSGPAILFCHGNPTWSFLYRNIIIRLRTSFRCIAVDYPGFGLSERPPGYGYTPQEHAAAVKELIESLNPGELIVMGQDWGGPICLSVAVSQPARIAGVILGNTSLLMSDRFANRIFSLVMSSRPLQSGIINRNLFVERAIPMATSRGLTEQEMDHYRRVQPTPEMRRGVAEFPRQLRIARPWLEDLAEDVRVQLSAKRALLVWGMKDFAFPGRVFIPRWQRIFPDNEVVKIPRAGHFLQEDAPVEIAEAIAARFG